MMNSTQAPKAAMQINVPIDVFLPCYQHLVSVPSIVNEILPEPDIDFLWGGRDSGKTRHIAMQLLLSCLSLPYFRCILVRKVANTIKDSQWQQLKDVAEEWKVDHLFNFKEHPLEIICFNGNKFLCRGMDEPSKLKSVSNPSHCWCEEGNQLEKDDFIVIMTSLRTNQGKVKTYFSFNPECEGEYQEFWLYQMFFAPRADTGKSIYTNFRGKWETQIKKQIAKTIKIYTVQFIYRCTWTTYQHNSYCRPERIAFLEQMAAVDSYYETVFTNGKWGNRKVNDPFCYCFDPAKHVGQTKINPTFEIYLSFDFNKNPITCGIYQHYPHLNRIVCIESIKLENSNIYALCDYILAKYGNYMMIITGDATGRNSSALVQDDLNYYTVIKQRLGLAQAQMRQPTINPDITENRVLVNTAFFKMDIVFDKDNCKDLIFDCKNVSVNDVGKIDKGDRNNPKKRADHLDHFRYYLNSFHKNILKVA